MAVELACRPNLPIHRNPIFLFANITFCPSAPNCSHSVSNVPSIFRVTHCAEGIYKKRPSRSEVRLCSMLMDRVQLCAGSPQMGPRSSFGSALGPLERVPKMSSLTLLAPQSGALRISAYRDFQSHPSHPIPLIAFERLSFSIVF